jgi:hypothetical protein
MKPTASGSPNFPQLQMKDKRFTPCRCVDWYAEGETRVLECGGVQIIVRYVGRQGRRGRIAIEAPGGATFR